MNGERESATIGIQNENGEIGQQVVYNDEYVHNFLGLTFEQAPAWLTIDNQNYIINQLSSQESINHAIMVDANEMIDGNYLTYIHIESNATGPITIPVSVQVGYQFDIGDVNYDGEINVQDVVVLLNFILGFDNPSQQQFVNGDMNSDGILNILDVIRVVNDILGNGRISDFGDNTFGMVTFKQNNNDLILSIFESLISFKYATLYSLGIRV